MGLFLHGWGGAVLLAAVVGDGGDEERREGRRSVKNIRYHSAVQNDLGILNHIAVILSDNTDDVGVEIHADLLADSAVVGVRRAVPSQPVIIDLSRAHYFETRCCIH